MRRKTFKEILIPELCLKCFHGGKFHILHNKQLACEICDEVCENYD